MAFAQHHAIRPESDIDLDIFVSFDELPAINPFLQFLHGDMLFEHIEPWQNFDLIAVDCSYDDVAINLWVINTKTFAEIARFEKDHLRFWSSKRPSDNKEYKVFGGGSCTLDRHVEPCSAGYASDRPTLHKGNVISENYVLNNMFFVYPIFGAEYSDKVVDTMWQAFLKKYPDASEAQLRQFIIDKVTGRFSPEFQARLTQIINQRTSH